jgi:hypothetical protein
MTTTSDQFNTWFRGQVERRQQQAHQATRLFGPDLDTMLDDLADEELRDPDVVQKLDPAMRRQLVEHAQARDALGRELQSRRRRRTEGSGDAA